MIAGSALPINGKLASFGLPQTAALGTIGTDAVCKVFGCPGAVQGAKNCKNAPVRSRNGPSKSTLFQTAFSQNKPMPPRIEVLPFFAGSQAKPSCGAKFEFGCLTALPNPGNKALSSGIAGYWLSVRPVSRSYRSP